ncbi:hypothetical protein [Halomicrococcus sp. NG-SE-24]|uniref:hypothetical protein n=1 Tax=Halomicrococcus sp. NG-SE-24 TaxID=3436928 RepID=UPI003D99B047
MGSATVEFDCIVAANAVVLQDQTVPERLLTYSAPAETSPLFDDQLDRISETCDHYINLEQRSVCHAILSC